MPDSLANKSREELLQVGESVCRDREWRWVAIWAYNIHRLFRGTMQRRKVWDELDGLIRVECDWHLGGNLFQSIRQITLSIEKAHRDTAEYLTFSWGRSLPNAFRTQVGVQTLRLQRAVDGADTGI
jgi:hypothetical protein